MKKIFCSILALAAIVIVTGCDSKSGTTTPASETIDSATVEQTASAGNDLLVECEAFTVERLSNWVVNEVNPENINLQLPSAKQGEFDGIIDWYITGYKSMDNALKAFKPGGSSEGAFKFRPDEIKLGDLSYTVLERDDNNFLYAELPNGKILKIELWGKLIDDPDVQKILSTFKLK
jgi:hypothetical protein